MNSDIFDTREIIEINGSKWIKYDRILLDNKERPGYNFYSCVNCGPSTYPIYKSQYYEDIRCDWCIQKTIISNEVCYNCCDDQYEDTSPYLCLLFKENE